MAVFSVKSGFSLALGAFVMGSILAGTVEAERIERIITPVKDLFGAVFFISVGMMVDPHDKRKANLVVDLDELKGTWTFQVIPKVKPTPTMNAEEAEAAMTDSMKALYMVPREYGFTLKRHYQASPVGLIVKENSLDDNSPVAYPKVTVYTSWHIINGRLYLYKDTVDEQGKRIPQSKVGFDDGTFVYLGTDSMAALFGKKVMQYHRKANAIEANAKAQAAEKKVSSADTIKK